MACCCVRGLALTFLILAFLCFACNKYAPQFMENALQSGIKSNLVWAPESPASVDERYRNSTTGPPDLVRFYLLNVTNPDEVRNGSAKPILVELGPYTYRTYRIKLDVWWNREGQVTYKAWQYYVEEPDLTFGNLDDNVTILNLPLIGVLETISASVDSPAARRYLALLAKVLEQFGDSHVQGVFTTRTVRELLWGFQDNLLVTLKRWLPKQINQTVFSLVQNLTSVEAALQLPSTVADTGLNDLNNLWNMHQVDGYREVRSWNGCVEAVRGSDAQQFPPNLTEESQLWVWVSELFRAARMIVTDVVELYGIRLLRFRPDPAQGDPDSCHYQTINGLMNVTSPRAAGPSGPSGQPGPPLFISMPHFCQADPALLEGVVGLQCNKSKHLTYVDVEPITGSTMRAFKRLQLSSQPSLSAKAIDPRIDTDVIIPVFWAEESSQLELGQAEDFKAAVYRTKHIIHMLQLYPFKAAIACAALGVFLMVLSLLPVRHKPRHKCDPRNADSHATSAARDSHIPGDGTLVANGAEWLTEPLLPADKTEDGRTGVPQAVTSHSVPIFDAAEATTSAVHGQPPVHGATSAVHEQLSVDVETVSETSAAHVETSVEVATSDVAPVDVAGISHCVSISPSDVDEASSSVRAHGCVLGAGTTEGASRRESTAEEDVILDVHPGLDQTQHVWGDPSVAAHKGCEYHGTAESYDVRTEKSTSGRPCSSSTQDFVTTNKQGPSHHVVADADCAGQVDDDRRDHPPITLLGMVLDQSVGMGGAGSEGGVQPLGGGMCRQGGDTSKKSDLPPSIVQLLTSHHIEFE